MARYDRDRSLLIIIKKKKKKKKTQNKRKQNRNKTTKATDKFENDRVECLKTPTRWRNVDKTERLFESPLNKSNLTRG